MQHICTLRHYLVCLQENKVIDDMTAPAADEKARNILSSITLRQDFTNVITGFWNETHLEK